MHFMLYLLCSGLFDFTFSSSRLRIFNVGDKEVTWNVSLEICNQTNGSSVTLYDDEDAEFTANYTVHRSAWLGLRKVRTITWSDGKPFSLSDSLVDVNLGDETLQMCVAIENNTWHNFNCAEERHFMCYKDGKYRLIDQNKTWCQALQHCRIHFGDLVSISNNTQNDTVIQEGRNSRSFWIGLMLDYWEWQDSGCSSFRKWGAIGCGPLDACLCTAHSQSTDRKGQLFRDKCENGKVSFCSKGFVRIKVITEKMTWERAFNYCKSQYSRLLSIEDEDDQSAVEQWLNHTSSSGAEGPFWIGLRQSRVFGFWIWSDRTVSWSNWKDGKVPELPLSNHCGVFNRDNYTWSDENCWVPHQVLCEEDIIYMKNNF